MQKPGLESLTRKLKLHVKSRQGLNKYSCLYSVICLAFKAYFSICRVSSNHDVINFEFSLPFLGGGNGSTRRKPPSHGQKQLKKLFQV